MKLNEHYTTILTAFKTWMQTLGFSKQVVYHSPLTLSYFFDWLEQQGINHVSCIKQKTLCTYIAYLEQRENLRRKGQTLSAAHLNKSFDVLDKFCEFLHHMGMKNAPSPTQYRILNPYKANFTVLTQKEIQDLYKAVPLTFEKYGIKHRQPRQAILTLILDLCYGCGLRRQEVTKLNLKDVDFNRRILHVKQAKGYKDRYVPMSEQIVKSIEFFVYQHRRYFYRRPEMLFPYTSHYIPFALDIIIRETENRVLKEKNVTPHCLRHSIATHLLENGMNIEKISRFLGHSSLDSTQIYTHLVNETQ